MHLEGGEGVPVMHGPMQANVVPHPLQGPLQTDGAKKKQYHGQERHVGKIREEGDFHDDDDEPPSRSHHKKRTNERRTKRSRRNSSGGSSSSSQSGHSSHGRFPKKETKKRGATYDVVDYVSVVAPIRWYIDFYTAHHLHKLPKLHLFAYVKEQSAYGGGGIVRDIEEVSVAIEKDIFVATPSKDVVTVNQEGEESLEDTSSTLEKGHLSNILFQQELQKGIVDCSPTVDTSKIAKIFDDKSQVGMARLVEYNKYYPKGLGWTRNIHVEQCDLAPDKYKCHPLSKNVVFDLVNEFGAVPKPCSFAADLMPFNPDTNEPLKCSKFDEKKYL
ncbi:hypothetical protein L7F22_023598 [Adiantum nelumboides]|nr:hypothetical protein [Adiantum nelumboides]